MEILACSEAKYKSWLDICLIVIAKTISCLVNICHIKWKLQIKTHGYASEAVQPVEIIHNLLADNNNTNNAHLSADSDMAANILCITMYTSTEGGTGAMDMHHSIIEA